MIWQRERRRDDFFTRYEPAAVPQHAEARARDGFVDERDRGLGRAELSPLSSRSRTAGTFVVESGCHAGVHRPAEHVRPCTQA